MIAPSPLSAAKSYQEAESQLGLKDLSNKQRISFCTTVGGTRSRVAIAVCDRDKDPSKRDNIRLKQSEICCPSQYETVRTILDIFKTLSDKGLEIANFNFAGFSAQEDPAKAEYISGIKLPKDEPGLYVLPNINLETASGQTPFYSGSNSLINVVKEISERAIGRKLLFIDSKNPPTHPYKVGEGKSLTVNLANDTIRTMLGALCSPNDSRIRSMIGRENIAAVGSFINGTGFNFGVGKNYNINLVRFNEVINEEIGHTNLPDKFLGPLDRLETDQSPVEVELCFAGGKEGTQDFDLLKGIRREVAILYKTLESKSQSGELDRYLREIANYYNKVAETYKLGYSIDANDIKQSQIFKGFEAGLARASYEVPSNRKLVDLADDVLAAKSGQESVNLDKLARAMLVSLFARQGQFIAENYDEQVAKMKVLAITGNHIIDTFDRVKVAREAFMKPLRELNPEIHLFTHVLHGTDGLGDMAVDILRLASGLVPGRDAATSSVKSDSKPGLIARLWTWLKSWFGK